MNDLEKESYTKEEVQNMLQEYDGKLSEVNTQLTEVNAKYLESTEQLQSMGDLKKNHLYTNIRLEMVKAGVPEDLFDLVISEDIDIAKGKIEKISNLNKQNVIDNSYKPQERKTSSNEYEIAENKNNVEGMIRSKMSKLFN